MSFTSFRNLLCASVLAAGASLAFAGEPVSVRGVLTNKDVVTLARAGFDDRFIADVIQGSRRRFDLSADALAQLAEQGLDQELIHFMMSFRSEPILPRPTPTRHSACFDDARFMTVLTPAPAACTTTVRTLELRKAGR